MKKSIIRQQVVPSIVNTLRQMQTIQWLHRELLDFQNKRTLKKLNSSFKNLDQFLSYIEAADYQPEDSYMVRQRHKNNIFEALGLYTGKQLRDAIFFNTLTNYHRWDIAERRRPFQCLFENIGINLEGASILDLGPGYGDSLDLAQEKGAIKIEFADYNPYFIFFNNLKGFKGYMIDYMSGKGLIPLYPNKYNVILSKGSINADYINRKAIGFIPLPKWLDQVENLTSPYGAIIICPTFDRGEEDEKPYLCRDVQAFKQSYFSKTLTDKGYQILFIEGFNEEGGFPFTFYKKII
jgi:hypothetical protein